MGIKTVPQPPYSPDVGLCDFWLFPKLRSCRSETIQEMKEAVTRVIDTLTQEDFHGAFQKLLERYNKCTAAGGDYFERDKSFMRVLSIKVPYEKSVETYLMILLSIYQCWSSFYFFLIRSSINLSFYIYIYIYINGEAELFYIRDFVTFQRQYDQIRRPIEKTRSLFDRSLKWF